MDSIPPLEILAGKPNASYDDEKTKKLMELCKVLESNKDANLDAVRNYCAKNRVAICNSVNSPIDVAGNVPLHLTVSQNDHVRV